MVAPVDPREERSWELGRVEQLKDRSFQFIYSQIFIKLLLCARKMYLVQGFSNREQPCPLTSGASHLAEKPDLEQEHRKHLPVPQCCLGLSLGVPCRIISVGC